MYCVIIAPVVDVSVERGGDISVVFVSVVNVSVAAFLFCEGAGGNKVPVRLTSVNFETLAGFSRGEFNPNPNPKP